MPKEILAFIAEMVVACGRWDLALMLLLMYVTYARPVEICTMQKLQLLRPIRTTGPLSRYTLVTASQELLAATPQRLRKTGAMDDIVMIDQHEWLGPRIADCLNGALTDYQLRHGARERTWLAEPVACNKFVRAGGGSRIAALAQLPRRRPPRVVQDRTGAVRGGHDTKAAGAAGPLIGRHSARPPVVVVVGEGRAEQLAPWQRRGFEAFGVSLASSPRTVSRGAASRRVDVWWAQLPWRLSARVSGFLRFISQLARLDQALLVLAGAARFPRGASRPFRALPVPCTPALVAITPG